MRTTILLLAATTLLAAGCEPRPVDRPPPASSAPSVAVESVEVLRVALDPPVRALDLAGESRTWSQAYMVRLALETANIPIAPLLGIYVGDYRVSETGSWEGGLYFYVHDPDLLARLDGGELFYQIDDAERRDLGARLSVGKPAELRLVPEGELFPNRRR